MDDWKPSSGFLELTFRNPFDGKRPPSTSPSPSCTCLDSISPVSMPEHTSVDACRSATLECFPATMVTQQLILDDGLPFTVTDSTSEGPSPSEEEKLTTATFTDRTVPSAKPSPSLPRATPATTRRESITGLFSDSIEDHGVVFDGSTDFLMTPKLSPARFFSSPQNTTTTASGANSVQSTQSRKPFGSFASSEGGEWMYASEGGEWMYDEVRELTDSIRTAVKSVGVIYGESAAELDVVISALLLEETSPDPTTALDLIIHTHFDKLIKEIVASKLFNAADLNSQLYGIFTKAESLERKWQRRFKVLYSDIDKYRTEEMMRSGILHDLKIAPKEEKGHMWIVDNPRCPDFAGSLDHNPGDWWPNLHCAYRDGIVGPVESALTKGKAGVVALALLTGQEVNGPTLNLIDYTKVGKKQDMFFSLMSCRHPIRILRGCNLRSKWAPAAGIRYDGL
ncbi:uncharacterized protein L3040_004435 [Drepanopeziza brunnea f. sp. 'multigermtubi']|uniref:uncharacterized protein n=1 Tax=Drepanopeziza brunnea f. sp. 'multigermtubi' TaxID=698441 RepID=UPI00238B3009|nr:hypothetical protein L3040_004435 [Drepanopeziza brunnea f. sp. 'multigermtubi']